MGNIGDGLADSVVGTVVRSKTGRDRGKYLVLIAVQKPPFVHVADGDLRKLDKPKKKNVKHLEMVGMVSAVLVQRLENKLRVTNADIRKAVAVFQDGDGKGGL